MSCKWIFKRKEGILGAEASKIKARLVATGFTQRQKRTSMKFSPL